MEKSRLEEETVHYACVDDDDLPMAPLGVACCGTPDSSVVESAGPEVNCPMCIMLIEDDLPCVHLPDGW